MGSFSPLLLRAGLRYLLRHRWQALLALTGIALGVAVVLAVELANSGARAAFRLSAQQLQGKATHRLVVPGASLPDEVYVRLQGEVGGPPMAPVASGWVRVAGYEGRYRLVGFDLFAEAPFRSQLAGLSDAGGFVRDWLTQPDALVLGQATARALAVSEGDTLDIVYQGRPVTLRVLRVEAQPGSAGQDLLLVDIATAKSILGLTGRLSHVDLILDAGSEQWVRQRIPPDVQLLTVAEQAQGVTRLSAAFELNLTAMSLLALLVRVGLRAGEAVPDSAWRTQQIYMGHIAISDVVAGRHHSAERFARAAAGLAGASTSPFAVWLGPWSLRGGTDLFPLRLSAGNDDIGLSLQLQAGGKPLLLQGEDGLSRKSARPGNASYYYSFTRLPTRGELRIGDASYRVAGDSWLDREWSSSALDDDQAGWDWFALQLEDGRELMFYQLRDKQGRAHPFSRGSLVQADGSSQALLPDAVKLTPLRHWRAEDGARYPVAWRLQVAEHELDLEVQALLDDQLMEHSVRYWEGAVRVSGSHRGRGYLELSGYD